MDRRNIEHPTPSRCQLMTLRPPCFRLHTRDAESILNRKGRRLAGLRAAGQQGAWPPSEDPGVSSPPHLHRPGNAISPLDGHASM